MSANLENSAVATGLENVSFHSNPTKKGNAKEYSNYHIIVLILHASKVMLKILHINFNCRWTKNFQVHMLGFKEAEEPEIKLSTFSGSRRKQRSSRKNLFLLHQLH